METQAAFVRADGAVELYAVADIYVYLTIVVCPRHAEGDDALRLYESFDELCFLKLRMAVVYVLY